MAMIVKHNLQAMNANRMLGINSATQAKPTEKLSSGYKINRAADDAAGLSISEKMRKQIRGLSQASLNAQDGISAVQTAEGALNEVQDMLQRMNELAVKAANGTNSEDDKSYIQDEINQLSTEIDRVAETTKFNETYLLKGDRNVEKEYTYSYKLNSAAATAEATMTTDAATTLTASITFDGNANQDDANAVAMALRDQGVNLELTTPADANGDPDTTNKSYNFSLIGSVAEKYVVTTTDATAGTFAIADKEGNAIATVTVSGGKGTSVGTEKATIIANSIKADKDADKLAQYYDKDGNGIPANALDKYFSVDSNGNTTVKADAPDLYDAVGNKTTPLAADIANLQDLTGDLSLTLHVGADATANNQITLNIASMSAKGLGVNDLTVDGPDDTNALKAVETIKEALQKVSTQRSALGAVQNRLEHTISNLDNVVENTTAAEAQIRDTDMATEMVKYSNNNILTQAGQAMLAQANQANQGVLSLLG